MLKGIDRVDVEKMLPLVGQSRMRRHSAHRVCTSLNTKGQFSMANPPNLHIFGH